jgi:CRP-like cAMP-binding protein
MQGTYAELWAEQIGGAITAEAGFDAKDALSRLALFAQLPADQLEGLASRMEVVDLAAGERINEADQRLCFVRRGRARVLTPSLGGDLVASAELGSGDAFGLAAALGQATGSVLEAVTAVSLLILKQSAFADIRRTFLAVSQPAGERRPELAPARARRLSRLTLGRPQLHEVQVGSGPAPTSQDVRRASGAMPLLR